MGIIFGEFGQFEDLDVPPPSFAGTVPSALYLALEDEVRQTLRRTHPVLLRCERIIGILGIALLGTLGLPVVLFSIAIGGAICIALLDLYVWILCLFFHNDGSFMSLPLVKHAWDVLTLTGHPLGWLVALIGDAILLGHSVKSGRLKKLTEFFGRLVEAENGKVSRTVAFINRSAWKDPSVGGLPFRGRPFQRLIWKRAGQVVGSLEWDAISAP